MINNRNDIYKKLQKLANQNSATFNNLSIDDLTAQYLEEQQLLMQYVSLSNVNTVA